ncbi:MAG: hypothetical protein Q9179_003143 [Wetmoreana sp. 5 TL-2023]
MCMQFRDVFRATKAAFEEEQRVDRGIYEASLARANARVRQAHFERDDLSQYYADQVKENKISTQNELDAMDKKFRAERAENKALREELARYRDRLAAADEALEHERSMKASGGSEKPDAQMPTAPDQTSIEALRQELHAAKQNAERADAATNLLEEEITRMRLDGKDLRDKVREVRRQHDELTATLDGLHQQDLRDLRMKEIQQHITAIKEVDKRLSVRVEEIQTFLDKPGHLIFGNAHQPANSIANETVSEDHT